MSFSVNTQPLLQSESEEDGISPLEEELERGHVYPRENHTSYPGNAAPTDGYGLGFVTFYMLGIVTLLPYTFFVTAHDYWMYKLRDTSLNETNRLNMTTLQAEFTSYLTIAAAAPSVLALFLQTLYGHRLSLGLRTFGSLGVILATFIVTTSLVLVNTDSWQKYFFALTLIIVILINVAGAILQASVLGIAAKISSKYISAIVSSQALGGIFPAIVYIGCLGVGASPVHSALLYFNIANIVVCFCILLYYFLSKSIFFNYHLLVKAPANTLTYDPANGHVDPPLLPQFSIFCAFRKTVVYSISIFILYTTTITVYPSITVLISSEREHSQWTDKYFVPVVSFLIFSIWDFLGRIIAGYLNWPSKQPYLTLLVTILRILFIPAFLICNAHPRHFLPVIIKSDSIYIALTCTFGLTNGYLTNNILINCPRMVDREEQEFASTVASFFISLGCAVGAIFSFICLQIL